MALGKGINWKSSLPVNSVVGIQNELGGERMKVLKKNWDGYVD